MPDTPEPVTCSICRMPKQASKAGSITQWIAVCRCDVAPDLSLDEEPNVSFCPACGKRIDEGRQGSFTQWVFRGSGDTCKCKGAAFKKEHGIGDEMQVLEQTVDGDALGDDADEPELEVGREGFPLDRYKPISVLGKGASSIVYMCRDRLLNKRVAVKILHVLSGEQLILFQQEARATSKLNHPGIVKILDFGALESSVPYMVLECVNGISLEKRIEEKGPFQLSQALDIFYLVADALLYAHENGIFHRDLKPSNILLIGEGAQGARLIDFGVAQHKTDAAEQRVVQGYSLVGTPAYMSPDQLDGKVFDPRSEVYSFGCLVFETLTGVPPFSAESVMELLAKHEHEEPPRLSDVRHDVSFSPEIEGLVAKCLAKSPDARFQDFRQVKDALRAMRLETHTAPASSQADLVDGKMRATGNVSSFIIVSGCVILALLTATWLGTMVFEPDQKSQIASKSKKKKKKKQSQQNVSSESSESPELFQPTWTAADDMYGVKTSQPPDPNKAKFVLKEENKKPVYEAQNDNIVDEDMQEVRLIPNLTNLSIRGCANLTGAGFKYLEGIPLQRLDMKWIALTDEGAKSFSALKDLIELNTCHITLTLAQVKEIGKLPSLERLNICYCCLTDESLKYLAGLKKLTYLNIEGNPDITLAGVAYLKNTNLQHLRVFGCRKIDNVAKLKKIMPNCHFEVGDYYMAPDMKTH